MIVFIGQLVLLRPSIALDAPPPATTDVFVLGGEGGDIVGGEGGDELGQEH
jgi:hypothetical protein